uniref:Uncharacterized protein n=1 Tax=Mimiviridae sp. ChoanoV1 TaxID=2596887 RepID=A0A5B8IP83_9VIRU|nr:hypothetical protein 2_3 [Mimiviridae sp. ChoanoV1]
MNIIDYTIIILFFQLMISILNCNIDKIYLITIFEIILIYLLFEINNLYIDITSLESLILKFEFELKNTCPAVDLYENIKIYKYH